MARKQREHRKRPRQGSSSARNRKSGLSKAIIPSRLSERSYSARDRALKALWDMRHGASASRAASDNGVSLRTLKRHASAALVQDRPGGRIRATKAIALCATCNWVRTVQSNSSSRIKRSE